MVVIASVRPLTHPGPRTNQRIIVAEGTSTGILIELTPGEPLMKQLTDAVRSLDFSSGFAEIYGGTVSPLQYCIPIPGDGVSRTVSYSERRFSAGGELVVASATIGKRDGNPFVHCHALWQTGESRRGGHLWPETLSGTTRPMAAIYGIQGVDWISTDDPETNMPVFTPHQSNTTGSETETSMTQAQRTVVARVLPNEDLLGAVKVICRDQKISQGVVRAGLGSLNGAVFIDHETGEHRIVDGPGTEVISVVGTVMEKDGDYEVNLQATLVDRHGVVHAGQLAEEVNLVAITFELTIQEIN